MYLFLLVFLALISQYGNKSTNQAFFGLNQFAVGGIVYS